MGLLDLKTQTPDSGWPLFNLVSQLDSSVILGFRTLTFWTRSLQTPAPDGTLLTPPSWSRKRVGSSFLEAFIETNFICVRSPFIFWHPTFLFYPTWPVISPREGGSVSCRCRFSWLSLAASLIPVLSTHSILFPY